MRLINAEKLLHQGYDYVVDGIAYDSCNKSMDIEDIPTVQAIPLEKIKQIKAEIKLYKPLNVLELTSAMATDGHEVRICKEFAIAILDKLIAESEGK